MLQYLEKCDYVVFFIRLSADNSWIVKGNIFFNPWWFWVKEAVSAE